MPSITFKQVSKSYGNTSIIREFTASIADKEFLVLLGPSGCGKSTMLRMIAGLTDISSGELLFDGELVNALEPRERNVAFVFQSYALYPHMTVRDNIAFPLIMDRFKGWYHIPILNSIMRRALAKRPDVSERVAEVAEMLELTDYLTRRPRTLSGGQRQRVAVARALVRDPSLYLLDEPLSNLDAKLRTQMRGEISALYRRVSKSFVYVTHDQVEAMTMATRIVVLDHGEVQQIGTPDEIYNSPANVFVARFIGAPAMNLIPVTVSSGRTMIRNSSQPIDVHCEQPDGDYLLGLRPETMALADSGTAVRTYIVAVEHLGGESVVGFQFDESAQGKLLSATAAQSTHYARIPGRVELTPGNAQDFCFSTDAGVWFDEKTGQSLTGESVSGDSSESVPSPLRDRSVVSE